ncbi:DUF309 domain-containing protein [Poseidonibacter ostreae]|jgi:hypothetical protein|uniref:DUF309 domain-containing protein n=1 Tax=Poseidonibacter ostreae TaxID=2654171 RepID=A0A6L4WPN6_9BACT|nr:DUF309 domain-containing protein [Poseidonibacter ostreae]KAB7885796.1 DUF309 domain-containing protein [Poseidonibacter ostreae]KAB7886967.1 DUF309 domain-containing protein [Poseidonibacter ostreae]KAB7887221.1 DUF309 domain-containing protein [Poseidonibacter ostreae]
MKIIDELSEIILLIDKNYFLNAHNKTEDLWRKYKNDKETRDESFILKAFVNAFAFFELYKMQRYEHANTIWKLFKKYEYLIDDLDSINKIEYKKIQELIYKKRDEI